MASFRIAETVVCSITVTTTSSGALTNPATSMNITITDPSGVKVVDAQAMTNNSTGKYSYDYTSLGTAISGKYVVVYTATDGTRVSKTNDSFDLGG